MRGERGRPEVGQGTGADPGLAPGRFGPPPGGPSRRPGGSVPDGLIVGGLAFLLGAVTLFWLATEVAGLLAHGGFPRPLPFLDTPAAIRSLATRPNSLAAAWPATPASRLPGPAVFWTTFFVLLALLVTLVLSIAISLSRSRARRRAHAVAAAAAAAAAAGRAGAGSATRPLRAPTGGGKNGETGENSDNGAKGGRPVRPAPEETSIHLSHPLSDEGTGIAAAAPAVPATPATPTPPTAPPPGARPTPRPTPTPGVPNGASASGAGRSPRITPLPDLTGRSACVFVPTPTPAKHALLDAVRAGHPGPVLVLTSSREAEIPPGAQLFDPQRLVESDGPDTGVSRVRWSPLAGCTDPATATARARALLSLARPLREPALSPLARARLNDGAHRTTGAYDTALTLLRCWLHAAALADRPVRQLHRWAGGSNSHEAVRTLRTSSHRELAEGWGGELESLLSAPHPELRDSAVSLVATALDALSELHVQQSCTPTSPNDRLEVESLLGEAGSLYLAGPASEQRTPRRSVMPLLTALVEDVVEHGRRMAARSPSGRLDPPLLLLLDDVAAVAPTPSLPELLARGGTLGMPTVAVLRSPEQARARWGSDVVHTLWKKSDVRLILGGTDPIAARPVLEELAPKAPVPGPDQAILLEGELPGASLTEIPHPRTAG
ncbi:TraM recognition domain-containing protein [Phaeacidiphilus oryzae]|uniref:TraM recognition domain-containing protein n=1 Tax=Phaeacidiphilus oryzae TaxID=348818 RepID=UPI00068A9945|nr:TraM recognition domain-containing protein [Phaeacidiphilus oryzae]